MFELRISQDQLNFLLRLLDQGLRQKGLEVLGSTVDMHNVLMAAVAAVEEKKKNEVVDKANLPKPS